MVTKDDSSNLTVEAEKFGPPTNTVPLKVGEEVKHEAQ